MDAGPWSKGRMAGRTQPILALHWVFLLPDSLSLESSGNLLLLPEGSMSSTPPKYWFGAFLLGSPSPRDTIIVLMTLVIDSWLQSPPAPPLCWKATAICL